MNGAGAGSRLSDLVIGLSLANLCFIRRWYELGQVQTRSMGYFRTTPGDWTLLWATLIAVMLLGGTFWAAAQLIRRLDIPWLKTAGRCAVLLTAAFPAETTRRYWNAQAGHVDWGSSAALLAIELMLVSGAVMVLLGNPRVFRSTKKALLSMIFLLPALLIEMALSAASAEPASAYLAKPGLAPVPARGPAVEGPRSRFIWLLFDELDQRLAFDQRPAGVRLPEMDRLRAESFSAAHAVQTASSTLPAIPSLFSGRIYTSAETLDADTLLLRPAGREELVDWRREPNVFQRARAGGANTALVGWHHPYCRVLGDSLVRCYSEPGTHFPSLLREANARRAGLWNTVGYAFQLLEVNLADLPHAERESVSERLKDRLIQRAQQRQYFTIRDRAYRDAADPGIDFLYVHFPAPHMFALYDAQRGDFTLSDHTTYLDNLALVDRTVGELRRTLEQAGLWNSTSVLVTSDHGLRRELWHNHLNWTRQFDDLLAGGSSPTVPFILKLAGHSDGVAHPQEFSSVVTGELALAVLRGEVTTPEQVSHWVTKQYPRQQEPAQTASTRRTREVPEP